MGIPRLGPFLRVAVDRGKEKVVKKPDMAGTCRVESVVALEVKEKNLPLLAKPMGDVVPETFYPGVVDTP